MNDGKKRGSSVELPAISDLKNRAADGFIHRSRTQFCVLRGLGQHPNKHETGGFRVNGIRLFSQSGYRFALLAALLPPFVPPYFPSTHTTIWTGCFGQFSGNYRKNSVRSKKRYSLFSSFNSTRFHAIRLSKYNCSVHVEDEYHTEHGQAALRRDFNFDPPVTQ